jgi:hypothetical protein
MPDLQAILEALKLFLFPLPIPFALPLPFPLFIPKEWFEALVALIQGLF